MQEQMNSMNDSGEFQEVESNHGGRLSLVPSQPGVIPSSSSMLTRDKRLPSDTWNAPGLQETVFLVINYLHLICSEILLKEFIMVSHTKHKERQNQFREQLEKGHLAQDMMIKIRVQFQCRCLRESR